MKQNLSSQQNLSKALVYAALIAGSITMIFPFAWMLLARAYGENGDMAGANYAAAEYSYRLGQYEAAKGQLKSAAAANPSKQMKLKIDDLNNRLKQIADQRARS